MRRAMVPRKLLNWFSGKESLLIPKELRISTDHALPALTYNLAGYRQNFVAVMATSYLGELVNACPNVYRY